MKEHNGVIYLIYDSQVLEFSEMGIFCSPSRTSEV